MPNVFKSFWGAVANDYIFPPAQDLKLDDFQPIENVEPPAPEEPEPPAEEEAAETAEAAEPEEPEEPPEPTPETDPIYFARIQAEAILADARREAESCREQLRADFERECEELRKAAQKQGYDRGYAEGMVNAMEDGRLDRERMAIEQVKSVEKFLDGAARARDKMLDETREELKDLAIAIAEKVIHVSLKNSSDVILRMVDAATDTHKRCEWAHIYIAECDVGGKAYTVPQLASALSHISDRVKIIPMPEEESGTCIVEMPDVILDASVSTQLDNLRETLDSAPLDAPEQ